MSPKLARTSTAVKLDIGQRSSTLVLMSALRDDLGETIQENVRRFRKESGLTQQRLADEAGVSVDAVRKWEAGRGVPDRESITKLAAVFGRKMDDFNMKDPPPPAERKAPVFSLKVAEGAPDELRKLAEDYIEQLNKGALMREGLEGVRQAKGQSDPRVTIRAGDARSSDRSRQPEPTREHPSARKRQRH